MDRKVGLLFAAFCLLFRIQASAVEIYRVDSDPFAHQDESGLNSFIDPISGDLSPANPQGFITPLDHIARSRDRSLRDNSQFSSFSTNPDLSHYYGGGFVITAELEHIAQGIASGDIPGVRVWTTEMLLQGFQDQLSEILRLERRDIQAALTFSQAKDSMLRDYFRMVRIERRPIQFTDRYFWDQVNGFREQFPQIFSDLGSEEYKAYSYVFNALRHSYADQEVLVQGILPSRYLSIRRLSQ